MNDKPSAVPFLSSHAADCAVLSRAQPSGERARSRLRRRAQCHRGVGLGAAVVAGCVKKVSNQRFWDTRCADLQGCCAAGLLDVSLVSRRRCCAPLARRREALPSRQLRQVSVSSASMLKAAAVPTT